LREFDKYITRWALIPEGEPIVTPYSKLLPVRYQTMPAMLKIAITAEEKVGGQLMQWWDGEGAARIFAYDEEAILMERAVGQKSLIAMAKHHQDNEASRIICTVVSQLHTPKNKPLSSTLIPLAVRFQALELAALQYGGILRKAATIANQLLQELQESVVLHGDIHHGNILDFDTRGWLAIDPKGLFGESTFDFANTFCNPDITIATYPGRLQQQATIIAETAHLDRTRLIQWVLAYAGLSAAWHLEEGTDAELAIAVAQIAFSALYG
jgi:streptomycin 6-kinase